MPLTRSTVGSESVNLAEQSAEDALHWIWSWRLQVRRLLESTNAQGQGATAVEKSRSFSAASYDEHILCVVGRHLVTALDRAGARLPPPVGNPTTIEAITLLRNLYEHWDEQRQAYETDAPKKRSAKRLEEMFPSGKPWSIVYGASDWLLAGIVPIGAVMRELDVLEAELLRRETAQVRSSS